MHDWGAAVGLAWAARASRARQAARRRQRDPAAAGLSLARTGAARAACRSSARSRSARRRSPSCATSRGARRRHPGRCPSRSSRTSPSCFDLGTERATRQLLRSASPDVLARAGANLGADDRARARPVGRPRPVHPGALRLRLRGEARRRDARADRRTPGTGRGSTGPRSARGSSSTWRAESCKGCRGAAPQAQPMDRRGARRGALPARVARPSADLAAQEYRADLGLTLWNNGWFAGHHTPGYSVLFPPLGGALGVRLTGALAAVAAAALFAPLARRHGADGRPTPPRCGSPPARPPCCSTAASRSCSASRSGSAALLALSHDRPRARARARRGDDARQPGRRAVRRARAAAWALAARARAGRGARRSPPRRSRRS